MPSPRTGREAVHRRRFDDADLIAGTAEGHSHGLLGSFDAIAPVASVALRALAPRDEATYRALPEPTVALSLEIFRSPRRHYKAGIVSSRG